MPTYMKRSCPHCGRELRVRTEYRGRQVSCRHCQAAFPAGRGGDPDPTDEAVDEPRDRAESESLDPHQRAEAARRDVERGCQTLRGELERAGQEAEAVRLERD